MATKSERKIASIMFSEGTGVVFPFKSVELYGGADYIGDFSFGIGVRYLVNK